MPEYYKIKGETLTNIADAIREKIGNGGQITPLDMPQEIASISNGTSITDGIVVKARDANGNPTEVDYYGDVVPSFCFGFNGYGTLDNSLNYVQKINWMTEVKTIKSAAFRMCKLQELTIPDTVTSVSWGADGMAHSSTQLTKIDWLSPVGLDYIAFTNDTALEVVNAPNIAQVNNRSSNAIYGAFKGCTSLETVVLGSVGHSITKIHDKSFSGCTQGNLTITVYTTGSYADTAVTNIRNGGATNATVIIKASEETTYNGTTYNAGDTILTSEVTS